MVDPNWGLMQGNNALSYMQYGMQIGRDARERQDKKELTAAEAELFAKPDDPNALAAYGKLNPKGAFAYRQSQQDQEAEKQKQAQGQAMAVAKLFDGVTPENYQQRLSVAQRMGIDVSTAPQQFDPNWVSENRIIMQTVAERPEALSTAGKIAVDEGYQPGSPEFNARVKQIVVSEATKIITPQPGAGALSYNTQTGQSTVLVQPNDGSGQFGQPVGAAPTMQGGPKPGAIIDGYRFKGGNPNDKANWEKAGGAGSNASGGFRGTAINPISDLGKHGLTPTSGFRTQQHQDALRAAGKTKTKTGSHPRGDGLDFDVPAGMTKQQAIALVQQKYPGARAIPSNGNSIHVTFPGWGRAPDVSGSRRRYGS